ncbi:MAG: hypothetical protein ACXWKA_09245 [Xanthobacteraceae bacterium]
MGLFVPEISSDSLAALRTPSDARTVSNDAHVSVNRALKTDRLTVCTPNNVTSASNTCRVGIAEKVQPATPVNGSVVGKTTVPRKASRDAASTPGRLPVKPRDPMPEINMPDGCESAVSVAADPELARTPSRCIS